MQTRLSLGAILLCACACQQTTEAPTQRLVREETPALKKKIELKNKHLTADQKAQIDSLVLFLKTHKGQAEQ